MGIVVREVKLSILELEFSLMAPQLGAVGKHNSRSTLDLVKFRGYIRRLEASGVDLLDLGARLVREEGELMKNGEVWRLPNAKLYIIECVAKVRPIEYIPSRWM